MKINITYAGKDHNEIEKITTRAFGEVEVFFDKKPKSIDIKIHTTRNSFEKELKRKTADWEVANASYSGNIDILHPDCFVKESTHEKEEFLPILKHEFSHLFLDLLSGGHRISKWLDEGFASYTAGLKIANSSLYIEEGFCKKLGTPKGWDENANYFAYQTAQMFVSFLVKQFSIKKIIKLIAGLEKNYYYANFNKNFKKIIGKSIEEAETDFIKALNATK